MNYKTSKKRVMQVAHYKYERVMIENEDLRETKANVRQSIWKNCLISAWSYEESRKNLVKWYI